MALVRRPIPRVGTNSGATAVAPSVCPHPFPTGARSLAWRRAGSGFFLGLQDLAALVHPALQVEMVRTAQFAGILVLDIGRLLDRIRRAAHAAARRRCFSSRNGHIQNPWRVWSEASSDKDGPAACGAG